MHSTTLALLRAVSGVSDVHATGLRGKSPRTPTQSVSLCGRHGRTVMEYVHTFVTPPPLKMATLTQRCVSLSPVFAQPHCSPLPGPCHAPSTSPPACHRSASPQRGRRGRGAHQGTGPDLWAYSAPMNTVCCVLFSAPTGVTGLPWAHGRTTAVAMPGVIGKMGGGLHACSGALYTGTG